MVTSIFAPGFANAGMSAVIITAATLSDLMVFAGMLMPNRWSAFAMLCTVNESLLSPLPASPTTRP